jgi:ribonucleoside-diphosphate reductase alpha chain
MAHVLPTDYQSFIHLSRYARFNEDAGRRETWEETVDRYINFFKRRVPPGTLNFDELRLAILNLEIMPSMRALMTAGPALERCNVAGYNCSYREIDEIAAFDEILYVLMSGTGVGFSVERQFIAKLPLVADTFTKIDSVIVVEDSKEGWASSLRAMLRYLWNGEIPKYDTHKLRPEGARLKTMGGRASGPQPLIDLFEYAIVLLQNAAGRRLTSLEVHDLVCKIADVVVMGGVRRSALLSLSNLSDDRMKGAKAGQWWVENGQRAPANNSVAYTDRPEIGAFMREWQSLYESKSGERGIFNREAAKRQSERSGRREIREPGTNPCSEIILRSKQFCNLTEVIVRADDDEADLLRKVRGAAMLGTLQATLTKFRYIGRSWKKNCEEEALLGVSLTGIMDNVVLGTNGDHLPPLLATLREEVIRVNAALAAKLGINPATATTCVKPSGTVSQLTDTSSGIHARHSAYYLRTVRADRKDPLATLMREAGCYHEPDVTKPDKTDVFYFPVKSPEGAVTRNDRTAIEMLELADTYNKHWCEHKVSLTVYVRDFDWMKVGAWCWDHFDDLAGVAFLPHSEHVYKQAPYQEITKEQYDDWVAKHTVEIPWGMIGKYEQGLDQTTGTRDLACSAGGCDVE